MRFTSYLIFILLALVGVAKADPAMQTYHNERFHYDITYPDSFSSLQKSVTKDGIHFKNKSMNFMVRGTTSATDLDTAYEQATRELNDFKVISAEKKYNYFVITAENATQVLYMKSIFICGENIYLQFTYPKTESSKWEAILAQMSQSFHYVLQECPSKTTSNK